MLRRTTLDLASKSSGTSSMYQSRPPKRKPKQFHVILNRGVSTRELIKEQRSSYTVPFQRVPLYYPGKGAMMNPKTLSIAPKYDGIVKRRDSFINPDARRWLEVDSDIQKQARSRAIDIELGVQNSRTAMSDSNPRYNSERQDCAHPDWRIAVQRQPKLTERFADVNTFTRGLVRSLKPKKKYSYF